VPNANIVGYLEIMTLENLFLFTTGSGLGASIVYLYVNLRNYKQVATKEAKKAIEKASAANTSTNSITGVNNNRNATIPNTNELFLSGPCNKSMLAGLTGLASFTAAANMPSSNNKWEDKHFPRLEDMF
jgi:hypothetical protein